MAIPALATIGIRSSSLQMKPRFPDPRIVATRKTLAARPPAPLERVLEQAAASRKFIADWRAKGLPDLPLPPHRFSATRPTAAP
jgi:hypothetical protein